MSDPAIIQARGLTKSFGGLQAVRELSFDVHRGECLGLLGPNGAGKTTTIRMLYGFCSPDAGTLQIFGLDSRTALRQIKARMGICQQEDNLDPDLTVRQNLAVYARYFDLPVAATRERIAHLLDFIKLEHRGDTPILALSGGMKRRLMLARSLINTPELLILDEPTTGLDPQSRQQIWQRLEELKAEGLTILLTTHYMDEAAQLCDRLIIVDHGAILEEGAPQELIARHVGRSLIEVRPAPAGLEEALRQQGLPVDNLGSRLVITPGDRDDLFGALQRQYPELGWSCRPATLEDVFLHLTGRELRE